MGLYDITDMNKLIQGSLGSMSTTKKVTSRKKRQVSCSEMLHNQWPVKYCAEASANFFADLQTLTRREISSDKK